MIWFFSYFVFEFIKYARNILFLSAMDRYTITKLKNLESE